VTAIAVSKSVDYIVTGSRDTTVISWEIDKSNNTNNIIKSESKKIYYGHDDEVMKKKKKKKKKKKIYIYIYVYIYISNH